MKILEEVLSYVLLISVWSLSVALVVGGVIGLVIGIRNRRIKLVLFPAIFGSFIGILITFVPIFSIPGLVKGAVFAGVEFLAALFIIGLIGSIAGGLVGGIHVSTLPKTEQKRLFWISIILSYLLLIVGILAQVVVFSS